MAASTLNLPGMPADEEILFNADLTAWEVTLETWGRTVVNNFNQIAIDCFGADYTLDNDGNANRTTPIVDSFAALDENETVTGDWTFTGTILGGITFAGLATFNLNIRLLSTGGTGYVTVAYANSNNDRTATWQDVGEDFTPATMTLKHMPAGTTMNLAIDLTANVLSVVDGEGGALSATNLGWAVIPSATAGLNTVVTIDEPKTVEDDGHGTTTLNMGLLGTTASVAWANPMPLYKYLYEDPNNPGEGLVFLCRIPNLATTPANANNIGIKGDDPTTSDQGNIFILESGLTKADHVSLPCICIGAVHVTRGADATDDWTFEALLDSDGIGGDRLVKTCATIYEFPVSQNGNDTGKHFDVSGGVAGTLAFGSYEAQYTISMDGQIVYMLDQFNCTANGNQTAVVECYPPLFITATTESTANTALADVGGIYAYCAYYTSATDFFQFRDLTTRNQIKDDEFAVTDSIIVSVTYKV